MPTYEPVQDYNRRRTVLCIKSRRTEAGFDAALAGYQHCVVHDANTACRKARLGAFDLYVAVDPHSSSAAVECWQGIRQFDRNTPFLFILHKRLPEPVEQTLAPGVDAYLLHSDIGSLRHVIQRLIASAERRSMEARREEALAIREEVRGRLEQLQCGLHLSWQSVARAQEHVMRAFAMQSFARLGGTNAFFERYWPEMFEEAVELSAGGVPDANGQPTQTPARAGKA